MRFLSKVPNFRFLRFQRLMAIGSITLTLLCFVSFFVRGMNFGIDFTGGTLMEVNYQQPVDAMAVRTTLAAAGFADAGVQRFGTLHDVLIRIPPHGEETSANLSNRAFTALKQAVGEKKVELRRVEYVGPQVGNELVEKAGLAVLYALIGILIYVAMRFELRFAVGAIIATIHDVLVTVGFFSLFHIEFDLTVLAAVLAVLGYSLNDTIVVFDRIRENFRRVRKGTVLEIVDLSLNETLSRTLVTHVVTSLAVLALYLFGGPVLHGFSVALLVGIVVGTYSSIYVASASAIALGISRADLVVAKKDVRVNSLP
jgi:preprotein translocase subunit SecF